MSRNFVLVTATSSKQDCQSESCAGIRKLKRGVAFNEFVEEYLKPLEVDELHVREDTTTAVKRTPGKVTTWSFTQYPENELIRAVSHLTKDELFRDLKELLPLKEIQR